MKKLLNLPLIGVLCLGAGTAGGQLVLMNTQPVTTVSKTSSDYERDLKRKVVDFNKSLESVAHVQKLVDERVKKLDVASSSINDNIKEVNRETKTEPETVTTTTTTIETVETVDDGFVDDDSDIWHITYHDDYFPKEAPADGSIAQFADGLFGAHSWSGNGHEIAKRHDYVEIDGRLYRYNDEFLLPNGSPMDDEFMESFRYDGGIALQTCYDSFNIIFMHYTPVEPEDAYPYDFSNYPRTYND